MHLTPKGASVNSFALQEPIRLDRVQQGQNPKVRLQSSGRRLSKEWGQTFPRTHNIAWNKCHFVRKACQNALGDQHSIGRFLSKEDGNPKVHALLAHVMRAQLFELLLRLRSWNC